jgi:hypothetical protein
LPRLCASETSSARACLMLGPITGRWLAGFDARDGAHDATRVVSRIAGLRCGCWRRIVGRFSAGNVGLVAAWPSSRRASRYASYSGTEPLPRRGLFSCCVGNEAGVPRPRTNRANIRSANAVAISGDTRSRSTSSRRRWPAGRPRACESDASDDADRRRNERRDERDLGVLVMRYQRWCGSGRRT